MAAVGIYKQQKYDQRKNWIQKRIDQLSDLKNTLFSSKSLGDNVDFSEYKSKVWDLLVKYAQSIAYVDFSDDYAFNSICNYFSNYEKYLYESYNSFLEGVLKSDKTNDETSKIENFLRDHQGKYSCSVRAYDVIDGKLLLKSTTDGFIRIKENKIYFQNGNLTWDDRVLKSNTKENQTDWYNFDTDFGPVQINSKFSTVIIGDLLNKELYMYDITSAKLE
jgi:hypothetical protein